MSCEPLKVLGVVLATSSLRGEVRKSSLTAILADHADVEGVVVSKIVQRGTVRATAAVTGKCRFA